MKQMACGSGERASGRVRWEVTVHLGRGEDGLSYPNCLCVSVFHAILPLERYTVNVMLVNKGHVHAVELAKKLLPKRDIGIFYSSKPDIPF